MPRRRVFCKGARMLLYKYRIADTVIGLRSELALCEDENSSLFRTHDPVAPDLNATIILSDKLPAVSGRKAADGFFSEFYYDGSRLSAVTMNRLTGKPSVAAEFPLDGGDISICALSCDKDYALNVRNLWSAFDLPQQLLLNSTLVLHASSIGYDGKAIVFSAPSGVGKSTQSALWEKYRGAVQLNGDKVALKKEGDKFFAYGLPFCGTSRICHNYKMPVEAIVTLGQASGSTAKRLSGLTALRALLPNLFGHMSIPYCRERLLKCVSDVLSALPIIQLDCLPDESAVIALEDELMGG